MEEGTKSKKTVFVGGISEDTDETTLYEGFSTFGVFIFSLFRPFFYFNKQVLIQKFLFLLEPGDIIEVQLPPPVLTHHQQTNPTGNGAFILRIPPSISIAFNDMCRAEAPRLRVHHFRVIC